MSVKTKEGDKDSLRSLCVRSCNDVQLCMRSIRGGKNLHDLCSCQAQALHHLEAAPRGYHPHSGADERCEIFYDGLLPIDRHMRKNGLDPSR